MMTFYRPRFRCQLGAKQTVTNVMYKYNIYLVRKRRRDAVVKPSFFVVRPLTGEGPREHTITAAGPLDRSEGPLYA